MESIENVAGVFEKRSGVTKEALWSRGYELSSEVKHLILNPSSINYALWNLMQIYLYHLALDS